MVKVIQVANSFEWEKLIEERDFKISQAIVEGILSNLNNKKKFIHIFDIDYTEENHITSVTLDRKYFAQTLEENLPHYENKELFEECAKIKQIIKNLKTKNNE